MVVAAPSVTIVGTTESTGHGERLFMALVVRPPGTDYRKSTPKRGLPSLTETIVSAKECLGAPVLPRPPQGRGEKLGM